MNIEEYKEIRKKEYEMLFYDGILREDTESLFIAHLMKNDNFDLYVDVGANKGAFIHNVLTNKPSIDVLAFEPDIRNYNYLTKRLHCDNVKLYNTAVYNKNGKQKLYYVNDITQSSLKYKIGNNFIKVNTIKLDNYYKEISKCSKPFIKIDVEGCEPEVLYGMNKILSLDYPMCVLFEYSYKWLYSENEIVKLFYYLSGKGFNMYRFNAFGLEQLPVTHAVPFIRKYYYSNIFIMKNTKLDIQQDIIGSNVGNVPFFKIVDNYSIEAKK